MATPHKNKLVDCFIELVSYRFLIPQ